MIKKRVYWNLACLAAITIFLGGIFVSNDMQAQEKVEKEYVQILPEVAEGALPQVTVKPLTFNVKRKTGEIPLEITPAGFWKSRKVLAEAGYDLFEFDIEAPSQSVVVGEPNMPIKVIEIDIPPNAELDKITLEPELLKVEENVTLIPNQEPLPVGIQEFILTEQKLVMDSELYKQEERYPGKFYEVITTDYYGDRKVVIIKTFPAQYIPGQKKVEFYRLKGSLKFKAEKIIKAKGTQDVLSDADKMLGTKVLNLPDAQTWERYKRIPPKEYFYKFEKMKFYKKIKTARIFPVPCMIITADLFYCPAKELAAHHTAKGIRTRVVRWRKIEQSIAGVDGPDKIRNFIKMAYYRLRTRHIILFGDVCNDPFKVISVPVRMAVDPAPYGSVDDGWIPCDYYYACLDGDWDGNNNGKYGEIADKPDLMPEICVGRIPTNNLDDAYKIVNCIKKYETSPPKKKGALLAANDLGWGCHEITFKENTYLPLVKGCPYKFVRRLYQKWNNLSLSTFASVINKGIDFIQYYGHGSPTSCQLMTAAQVKSTLKHTPSYPVMFALSCSTSRYDNQECFGEAWVECSVASSYIGSVRVAYGSLSTGEGLDIRFIKNFCKLLRTGCALDRAKYQLFKDYGWNTTTIKTILEFTLFGDPIMKHVN